MKRMSFLYEQLCSHDLIDQAITEAARGKKHRGEVVPVLENREAHIEWLMDKFKSETLEVTPYFEFNCYDPHSKKTRAIHRPAFFPDQVVHWCMVLVLKPVFMKGMYKYCSGSIPGRGAAYGCKAVRRWIDENPDTTKYVAQMDIRKFYETIDHDELMKVWRTHIKDQKMLNLIEKLLRTAPGVPIGNYTSQWMANFFLQSLDHYIKEQLHIPHYIRYIDDLVLFASSSTELHTAVRKIQEYLAGLKLELKPNWQVYPLDKRGLDFLGFVFKRDHTLIRGRNFLSFTRQARLIRKRLDDDDPVSFYEAASLLSRTALIKRGSHVKILQKYLPYSYQLQLRRIVGKGMRKRHYQKLEQGGNTHAVCCSGQEESSARDLAERRPSLPKRSNRGTIFYGVSEPVPSTSGLNRSYPRMGLGLRKQCVRRTR